MAQVHLTNQVIPREKLEQWEREADASMSGSSTARPCSLLLRGRCGPKSWREYVVAEYNQHPHNEPLCCIGSTCCIPVFLLHLPFCCCRNADGQPAGRPPQHIMAFVTLEEILLRCKGTSACPEA